MHASATQKALEAALDTISRYAVALGESGRIKNFIPIRKISIHNTIGVGSNVYNKYVGKCQIVGITEAAQSKKWAMCKYTVIHVPSGETRIFYRSDPLTAFFFRAEDIF